MSGGYPGWRRSRSLPGRTPTPTRLAREDDHIMAGFAAFRRSWPVAEVHTPAGPRAVTRCLARPTPATPRQPGGCGGQRRRKDGVAVTHHALYVLHVTKES